MRDVRRKVRHGELSLRDVPPIYSEWVREDDALIFQATDQETGASSIFAKLAPKRGNRAYVERVKSRFRGIEDVIEEDCRIEPAKARSNTLFITLTVDRSFDLESAWSSLGVWFNRFRNAMKARYGPFEYVRVFQAHKDGYPHIHLIAIFRDATFGTFLDRGTVRVQEKRDIEASWPFGFMDVEVPASVTATRTHILRYVERFILQEEPQGDSEEERAFRAFQARFAETVGYEWFFGKRSFAISRGWNKRLKDIRMNLHRASEASPTLRLDTLPCVTKITLLGISSFAEARRAAVEPDAKGDVFILSTLPLDLVERYEPMDVNESEPRDVIAGWRINEPKPGTLEAWLGEEPIYDELSRKARERMRRMWRELEGARFGSKRTR